MFYKTSRARGEKFAQPHTPKMPKFTKYEKAGDGFYEKKAGKGPDVISRD